PRPAVLRAVRALRRQRRARRVRPEPAPGATSIEALRRAAAGDAGVVVRRGSAGAGDRYSHGNLYGPPAAFVVFTRAARGLIGGRFLAHVSHRDFVDSRLLGAARLAALVRPRRRGAGRLVDDGLPHRLGPEGAGPALDHAGPVPDDADPAPGARRDAGSAAHRLHPLPPGAAPH